MCILYTTFFYMGFWCILSESKLVLSQILWTEFFVSLEWFKKSNKCNCIAVLENYFHLTCGMTIWITYWYSIVSGWLLFNLTGCGRTILVVVRCFLKNIVGLAKRIASILIDNNLLLKYFAFLTCEKITRILNLILIFLKLACSIFLVSYSWGVSWNRIFLKVLLSSLE